MAIFKGRDELIKNLQDAKRPEDRKGLEGEIEVGDLLRELLPQDTYIIAQPEIGELQPDFLIISPEYGFRIIEVKNMKINYIEEVMTNGGLKSRYGIMNPLNQVKSHVDLLKNFLVSNYSDVILGDPYRNIGYCVIHKGFSKKEFEYKFSRQLEGWYAKGREDYYKYHLFFDQINRNINKVLKGATKFGDKEFYINEQQLKKIVGSIKVASSIKNDDGYFERFDEQEGKIALVNAEVKKIREEIQIHKYNSLQELNTNKQSKSSNSNLAVYAVVGILIFIMGMIFIKTPNNLNVASPENETNSSLSVPDKTPDNLNVADPENETNSSLSVPNNFANLNERLGDYVEIEGKVNRFYYDSNSGTKFLTLSDGVNTLEAVIFKNTKVPFVEEGKSYLFEGYIQASKTDNNVELKVIKIQ